MNVTRPRKKTKILQAEEGPNPELKELLNTKHLAGKARATGSQSAMDVDLPEVTDSAMQVDIAPRVQFKNPVVEPTPPSLHEPQVQIRSPSIEIDGPFDKISGQRVNLSRGTPSDTVEFVDSPAPHVQGQSDIPGSSPIIFDPTPDGTPQNSFDGEPEGTVEAKWPPSKIPKHLEEFSDDDAEELPSASTVVPAGASAFATTTGGDANGGNTNTTPRNLSARQDKGKAPTKDKNATGEASRARIPDRQQPIAQGAPEGWTLPAWQQAFAGGAAGVPRNSDAVYEHLDELRLREKDMFESVSTPYRIFSMY